MEQEPVVEFGFSLPSRSPTASMGNLRTLAPHADAPTASAMRRTARLGDGWHPIGLRPPANLNPDEMAKAVAQLHDEAVDAGRNPQEITISFRGPIDFSDTGGADRQPLSGSVAAIQDDIARYAACGVSHMVFDVMAPDVADLQRAMDRLVQDVKPGVNA
jgi:alkanesulfonate monooxygenase SsuD/methylene tetrahydromethanopterin reductase-like flavin-dependent oxidoreductase (luciferase family)